MRIKIQSLSFYTIATFFVTFLPALFSRYQEITNKPLANYCFIDFMINYKGGFVRRGLIGEICSYFTDYVSIPHVLPLTVIIAYLLFGYFAIRWLCKCLHADLVFLFVFSPGLLAFGIKHQSNFYRRDVLIFLAIFSLIRLCCKREKQEQREKPAIFALKFWIIYTTILLVSETILFFMPIAVVIMAIVLRNEGELKLCVFSTLVAVIIGVIVIVAGSADADTVEAIKTYMQTTYPNFKHQYPIEVLSTGISEKINLVLRVPKRSPQVLFSTILAFLLTMIPTIIIVARYQLWASLKQMLPEKWMQMIFFGSLLLPFTLFIIAFDYGRWINMICTIFMLSATAFLDIAQHRKINHKYISDKSSYCLVYILFLTLYTTTWWVPHLYNKSHAFNLTNFGEFLLKLI